MSYWKTKLYIPVILQFCCRMSSFHTRRSAHVQYYRTANRIQQVRRQAASLSEMR